MSGRINSATGSTSDITPYAPARKSPDSAQEAWKQVVTDAARKAIDSPAPRDTKAPRPSHEQPTEFTTHKVVPGEWFLRIAHDNGMGRRQMFRANRQFDPRR